MTLTREQLAEYERLTNQATPGPWGWRGQDDGSVELRALHSGGLRIITTSTALPCIDYHAGEYFLRDEETLEDGPCDTCKKAYANSSFLEGRVQCERPDTWDTVHVWNPVGFCEPLNKHTVRQQPYRADVARTTHPDAEFIAAAREAMPELIREVMESHAHRAALADRVRVLEAQLVQQSAEGTDQP